MTDPLIYFIPGTKEGFDRLFRLHTRLCQADPAIPAWNEAAILSGYQDKLIRGDAHFVLASQQDTDTGYAWFQLYQDEFLLREIYLLPENKPQTTFSSLIRSGLEKIKDLGFLSCRYSGPGADPLLAAALQSCGFNLEEEHILMEAELVRYPQETAGLKTQTFAEIGDPGWLLDFIQECLECRQVYDRQDMLDLIRRQDNLSFVAFENSQPAGFLTGEVPLAQKTGETPFYYVAEIGVSPRFRRQGYASRMLYEAFARAARRGLLLAHLHVVSSNLPGLSLYRKLGFIESSRTGWWKYKYNGAV